MTSTDFAAAQQRLAIRRHAREAELQSRAQAQQNRTALQLSTLPAPLARVGEASVSTWRRVSGRAGTNPFFRVGQVDAELLDEELLSLLKSQVGNALKYYGTHLQDDYADEILLALRAVLFKLTVWDHDATYGAALQNLRFTDARKRGSVLRSPSRWQKMLYGLGTVGGGYCWGKWEAWLAGKDDGYEAPSTVVKRLSAITSRLSAIHDAAALASFLVFLVNGRYRTLLDRILRLRLAPPTSQVSREVSFEYLNRQLVWHAFTEFLLFLLPLVGISRWRRWLARGWRRTKALIRTGADDSTTPEKAGEYAFLPERTCAICYQDQNAAVSEADMLAVSATGGGLAGNASTDVTNPYETVPCACVYCFVCLAGRIEAEEGEGWVCLRCGELAMRCRPWNGDVLPMEPGKGEGGKKVGFEDPRQMEESMVEVIREELDEEEEEGDGNGSEIGDEGIDVTSVSDGEKDEHSDYDDDDDDDDEVVNR